VAIGMALVFAIVASRVAGHLSRLLGRPLAELVVWAERIGRGEPLPEGPPRRGAPEFELLREQMRTMARELDAGRVQALEAQRLAAFRETARQVAHELKNPLTPIRFAVARLRREAAPALQDDVEVLAIETERLERMARSFAAFGRLPDGPAALVDLGELVRYTARATVPESMELRMEIDDASLMVTGYHDAIAGAVSNVLINAVEACRATGTITARVRRESRVDATVVVITVSDTGAGIAPMQLARIWDPYFTGKPGGTGLGLAIVRQTIAAHGGSTSAESEPGVGTTIRLVLPAAPAPAATTAPSIPA
jgi:signal transduction histidine kinase